MSASMPIDNLNMEMTKKKRKNQEKPSSFEHGKPSKKIMKVNFTKDVMYDPHVCMSLINIDEMDVSEDPSLGII